MANQINGTIYCYLLLVAIVMMCWHETAGKHLGAAQHWNQTVCADLPRNSHRGRNVTTGSRRRIAGGYLALEKDFPSFVTMKSLTKTQEYFCSGVIVGERTVMTAAHCLDLADFETIHVHLGVLGFHVWTDDIYIGQKYCRSSGVQRSGRPYDYAAIQLDRAIRFGHEKPKAVALNERKLSPSDTAYVVGAGDMDDHETMPSIAMVLPVRLVRCSSDMADVTHMCLLASDKNYQGDSCGGDSGGPVYATINGKQELFGLTSFGRKPCKAGVAQAGAYTNFWNQLNDVKKLIADCS